MPQSAEDAVRIAILSEPSAFGLAPTDVNPMLLYQLRKADPKYSEQGTAELWKLCFDSVNSLLYAKVTEVFAGVNHRKDELVHAATSTEEPEPGKPRATAKSGNGKAEASNGNGGRGDKLTTKQLRYLGFLHRKLGEEPDYSVISTLTQGQATMRIKDMEQRVNG